MNAEMPKDLKKWEETCKKGKPKFILLHGVLAWGAPMFFVMTYVVNRTEAPRPPGLLLVSVVLWAIGGAFFGLTMWTMSGKKYQKYLADQPPEPPRPPPPPH